ncbi:MAG: LacI family transcriptional regulator [Chitinophagaceae bacterium]|nr:MAG: LacI family transcriptional regulator [Chitinophagaceae bacterium]
MEQKPTTIKEIAKRLNISFSTVSRALHNHKNIGVGTKLRVQQMAKELNYEPNQTAIFFQQRKTFTIGVILPELSEAFFSTSITGIEDTAEKNKYTVLLGQSHDSEEREIKIVETMKNHRVDGIIISISKNTVNYEHFESLRKYGIPVVFFDRIPKMNEIHYVACNMISGTVQAVSYLIKKGHRSIGMINGPEKLFASQERKDGYIQAMTKNRLKFDPSLVVNSDLTLEGTQLAMEELLKSKRKPTAIVTFNDYVALDAIQFALKKKKKVNKDISFVSFANLPISSYSAYPPLASVEQHPYIQGQKATEILIELMNKTKQDPLQADAYYKIIIESQLIPHLKK